MSVLPLALPVVHVQMFGSSVHLSPPEKMMSLPLYSSVKCNVVKAFKGTPARVKTPPPLAELVTQSPTFASGMFANRSPSMPKPPAGTVTGATPAGGGTASAGWLPKRRKESRARETRVSSRHLHGELVEFIGIKKCSIGEARRLARHDGPRLRGINFNLKKCEICFGGYM